MPRRIKPIKGQVSLIGEVHEYELKYVPHAEDGVVVLRLPPDASEFDKAASFDAIRKLLGIAKPKPKFVRVNGKYRYKKDND